MNNIIIILMVIVHFPYGAKRTGAAVRNQILKNKQELEKKGETFPFNRIISIPTILEWINNFEWEKHRLDKYYEKSITIDDKVNEFNIRQIERKSKRINNLNNVLDALQNIIVKNTMNMHSLNISNADGTINSNFKELSNINIQLGYLYKSLETLHDTGTLAINTVTGFVADWKDIKERLQTHHNPYTSNEEYLDGELKTIDYFFDNYETE